MRPFRHDPVVTPISLVSQFNTKYPYLNDTIICTNIYSIRSSGVLIISTKIQFNINLETKTS